VLPRFFAPDAAAPSAVVTLPEEEAAHLTRVLRLRPGDAVRVFDGRGLEWEATVEEVGRGRASVRLGDSVAAGPEPGVSITLYQSVLKPDQMDHAVRDAVMMGVLAICPLLTTHTEATASSIARGRRVTRWQRISIASAKQCGRAVVPPVADPVTLGEVPRVSAGNRIVLVEPGALDRPSISIERLPKVGATELFVGPEGGWSAEEIEKLAAAGGVLVTLGRHTIRAAAMAVVAISALRAVWHDF
jgi:16S rRNA (uracil1498-N3)-methyltransferase